MRLLNILIIFISTLITVNCYQLYCKCQCNNAKTIITKVNKCGECTKEYCLSKDSKLCEVEKDQKEENSNKDETDQDSSKSKTKPTKPKESNEDIIISCYQVESLKDGIIIYSFFTLILGLMIRLFYSSFKNG